MAGTTAVSPLDGLTDGARSLLAAAPPPAEVEAELQRVARERLGRATEDEAASRSHRSPRSLRHQRRSLVGAFDSPAGFAFVSEQANRQR